MPPSAMIALIDAIAVNAVGERRRLVGDKDGGGEGVGAQCTVRLRCYAGCKLIIKRIVAEYQL